MVGAGSCALLGFAGYRFFTVRVGAIAGFGLAISDAPAIFFDALLQKSVLDLFFITLSLWLLGRLADDASRRSGWIRARHRDGRHEPDARERARLRGGHRSVGAVATRPAARRPSFHAADSRTRTIHDAHAERCDSPSSGSPSSSCQSRCATTRSAAVSI
ncbi:MAG: hypothetical protein QM736_18130 [Vicinamibacterales bacterium]